MMPTNGEALRAAFDSGDLEQLIDLMDPRVVWRGLIDERDGVDDEAEDDHDHGPPLCVDRDQVRSVCRDYFASGASGHPVVLVEVGDTVLVDPRPTPPLAYPLHQAFTFRGSRVVLIQDYEDRDAALADVGL